MFKHKLCSICNKREGRDSYYFFCVAGEKKEKKRKCSAAENTSGLCRVQKSNSLIFRQTKENAFNAIITAAPFTCNICKCIFAK